jgi:hypothetical protein
MRKTKKHQKRRMTQLDYEIKLFRHLENTIKTVDKENDSLERKVLLLSMFSVLLTLFGIILALSQWG